MYKAGQNLVCPCCGERSVVKVANRVVDWKCVGQVYACALCAHELGEVSSNVPVADADRESARRNAAISLFGADDDDSGTPDTAMVFGPERAHFCKDCRHYFKNTFKSCCLLWKCDVGPMDDCARFEPKSATKTEDKE